MNVIACTPVKGSPLPGVIGSRMVSCANCKANVWASPATQKMLLDKDSQAYCLMPCSAIKMLELRSETDALVEIGGVEGWEDEARQHIGEQGITDVKAFLIEMNEIGRDED